MPMPLPSSTPITITRRERRQATNAHRLAATSKFHVSPPLFVWFCLQRMGEMTVGRRMYVCFSSLSSLSPASQKKKMGERRWEESPEGGYLLVHLETAPRPGRFRSLCFGCDTHQKEKGLTGKSFGENISDSSC